MSLRIFLDKNQGTVLRLTDFKKKCFKEARLAGVDLAGYTALEEGTKWYGRNAYAHATR